jgi:hypothetical protein
MKDGRALEEAGDLVRATMHAKLRGRKIRGSMRQQDKLREPLERLPLGKLGLNGMYGAIAGTDGQRIDAAAGHMCEKDGKLAKTVKDCQFNGILAQGAPQPFAFASFSSGKRVDDQSDCHLVVRGSLIHELSLPLRALVENAWAS